MELTFLYIHDPAFVIADRIWKNVPRQGDIVHFSGHAAMKVLWVAWHDVKGRMDHPNIKVMLTPLDESEVKKGWGGKG